ncbi:collagen alpha-1(I) chain [Marmota monax]|uniref:collagen alpha-1(I) chain n=1 Tax=Marmota monax TaxID=9995 RepID=UPI001EB09BDB|nr:collagen alpha-1(I) chain [Marmota monax]
MHHHPRNRERAINLSILSVSGPDFGFPEAARRVMGITPPHRQSASFMVGTTTERGEPREESERQAHTRPLERRVAGQSGGTRGAHRAALAGAAGGGSGGGGRWTRYRGEEEEEEREARRGSGDPRRHNQPRPLPPRTPAARRGGPLSPPARRNPGGRPWSRREGGHADRTASPPTEAGQTPGSRAHEGRRPGRGTEGEPRRPRPRRPPRETHAARRARGRDGGAPEAGRDPPRTVPPDPHTTSRARENEGRERQRRTAPHEPNGGTEPPRGPGRRARADGDGGASGSGPCPSPPPLPRPGNGAAARAGNDSSRPDRVVAGHTHPSGTTLTRHRAGARRPGGGGGGGPVVPPQAPAHNDAVASGQAAVAARRRGPRRAPPWERTREGSRERAGQGPRRPDGDGPGSTRRRRLQPACGAARQKGGRKRERTPAHPRRSPARRELAEPRGRTGRTTPGRHTVYHRQRTHQAHGRSRVAPDEPPAGFPASANLPGGPSRGTGPRRPTAAARGGEPPNPQPAHRDEHPQRQPPVQRAHHHTRYTPGRGRQRGRDQSARGGGPAEARRGAQPRRDGGRAGGREGRRNAERKPGRRPRAQSRAARKTSGVPPPHARAVPHRLRRQPGLRSQPRSLPTRPAAPPPQGGPPRDETRLDSKRQHATPHLVPVESHDLGLSSSRVRSLTTPPAERSQGGPRRPRPGPAHKHAGRPPARDRERAEGHSQRARGKGGRGPSTPGCANRAPPPPRAHARHQRPTQWPHVRQRAPARPSGNPPPTRRGEARAAVGTKSRRSAPTRGGPADPCPPRRREGGGLSPTHTTDGSVAHEAGGGQWGNPVPRTRHALHRSLEKRSSLRAGRTQPSPSPNRPPRQRGGSAVWASTRLLLSVRGQGHPKPHRLGGRTGPSSASRQQSLKRPGNISFPPTGGGEERPGARSPNTRPTPLGTGDDNATRSPRRGNGQRCRAYRLDPPSEATPLLPSGARLRNPRRRGETDSEAAAGRGSGTGTGNSTHRLSLRHLRKRPGAPQEHRSRGAPSRRSSTAAALPGAGRATHAALGRPERAASEKHPLRQRTPGARSRPDSAPPPFPAPRTGGEARRGTRRQDEKSWPIRHECPSLAWRGFGPAQESTESPHRSAQWAGETQGAGGDPARTASKRSLLRPRRPHTPGRAADDTERGTPDTRLRAMETSVVTPPPVPAARSARAVKDHPPPPPPPSGARRPAGRRWHHREGAPGAPKSRRTQAQASSSRGNGSGPPHQPRARHAPGGPSSLPPSGGTRQRTTCQHLPDGRKRPTRAKNNRDRGNGEQFTQHCRLP